MLGEEMPGQRPDLALLPAEKTAEADLFALGCSLRDTGFSAVNLYTGNMGKKMKAASKLEARFAIIAGDDELGRGSVSVRNMQDGVQTEVKISALTSWLENVLSR